MARNVRLDGERVNDRLSNRVADSAIPLATVRPSRKVRKRHDLIDVEMVYHSKTDKAVLASLDGQRTKAVWLPLSQVEYVKIQGLRIAVTMPEWLYVEKGFDKVK